MKTKLFWVSNESDVEKINEFIGELNAEIRVFPQEGGSVYFIRILPLVEAQAK